MMKQILNIYDAPRGHWVGNGFPVRSLFSYHTHAEQISPFLLLDYAGPAEFSATNQRRGVGQHPHRGFETVTIVYQGEVEHKDSTGAGGVIGPGDVQWMTAAAGILHEEFHSSRFSREGGMLEMVQLWVNLPAKDKKAPPAYQTLLADTIPAVALPEQAGQLRVIAGEYAGYQGPARTFTEMNVWDIRLNSNHSVQFSLTSGHTLMLVVLKGSVQVNEQEQLAEAQLMLLSREGEDLLLQADSDTILLLLSGEPIDEPIVGHGPFVMNTEQEIRQAIHEFNSGQFV